MKQPQMELIRRQDWHYEQAGRDWRDGLLLGNGNLGAAAYAPAHLEWVVNKVDVFDPTTEKTLLDKIIPHEEFLRRINRMNPKNTLFLQELENAPHERGIQRDTLSAAVLRLRFWNGIGWAAPAVPQTSQHLSLWDGVLTETMNAHGFHPETRMFIPHGYGVFCLRITEPGNSDRTHIFELVRPANEILSEPVWHTSGGVIGFVQKLPGGKAFYAVAMCAVPRNGGGQWSVRELHGNRGSALQYGDADMFLSVRSSFETDDPFAAAADEAENAARLGFDALEKQHREWWHDYWSGAYADFGKYEKIQKYFTFGLYTLASSFGKPPMPGLNGLAYGPLDEQTPGVGSQGYTHDQNAQIPAMPFFPLNRVEMVRVLADTYLNRKKTLRRHTKQLFGCDGIFLPVSMNQLGLEYPALSYRYTLCGSAYTGMILSRAWQWSRDPVLLRDKIYPLLREFAGFYTAIMRMGKDGYYHLDWSVPPEIFTLTRDESSALSMFRICLETLVETSELLHCDAAKRRQWKDILAHYPPPSKTRSGAYWCGPDIPENHYFYGGHLLYPFFPAGIDPDPDAAKKTLSLLESDAVERSFADQAGKWHPNHEWSMFLMTASYLRCRDREKGWNGLERFLELFAKENGLFSHDPILIGDPAESEENARKNAFRLNRRRRWCDGTILKEDNPEVPHPSCVTPNPDAKRLAPAVMEGSSSFLFLAAESLLQSHTGIIQLFPCVPEDFTGSFEKFLAQGAFEVSAAMVKGKVVRVRIKAIRGGTFRLKIDPAGNIISRELKPGGIFQQQWPDK